MRILKRVLLVLLTVVVALSGWAVFLATTTPEPRVAEGWTRLRDLPRPRGEVASAAGARVDPDCEQNADDCDPSVERIFVIGGLAGPGRSVRSVDVYSPAADRWTRGADIPKPRHHSAAAGTGGVVYVTGGAAAATNWRPERNLWMLLPNESEWRSGPQMPEGRMAHQVAAVDRKLFVIGGRGASSNVLIFDTAAARWSTGAQMPVQRDHLGVAVMDGKIYAVGGRDTDLLPRVDMYDPAEDAWSPGPPLPIPMSAMAVATTLEPDEGIHVVGGEDPSTIGGRVFNRHYFLPKGASDWIEAPLPVIATHGSAAAVVFGRLHIAGGARRQGSLSPLGWTGVLQRYGS